MIREIAPGPRLRDWVDAFWVSRPGFVPPSPILPDNCSDALFDLDAAEGFVVGAMTAPLLMTDGQAPAYFGIRFRPGRGRSFFDAPLRLVTDQRVLLSAFGDHSPLARQLADARDDEARIAIAERAIEARLARSEAIDLRVDAAITRLTMRGQSIDDVARAVGLTRQHLRRRFLEQVGIAPKTFARIARFQRVLGDARRTVSASWAALAVDHGYADQSHLIAEFRELAGMSPGRYLAAREPGLIRTSYAAAPSART